MINKSSIMMVGSVVVLSGALVATMAYWLGPDQSNQKLNKTDERLEAPLTAAALQAYQVDMTNENNPVATLVTNKGTIELELFADTMPITTDNFIKLAEEGFYDGVKFHRVIENFMIQSGDPITKTEEYIRYGTGGPGYVIQDEHVAGEFLTNVRGTIAMANKGPESGGSQFFINLVDNTNLDFDKVPLTSKHPVFGRVIKGMDVVDTIGKSETNDNNLPLEPIIIESVTIKE